MAAVNKAHDAGQACLAFSRDGSILYTGGSDLIARVWQADRGPDIEPSIAMEAEGPITCLAASDDSWFAGSADSNLRTYVKGEHDMSGIVTANPGGDSIRSVAVDPHSKRIAVTSDDKGVKVINLQDTKQIVLLEGHSRGVRRATWNPSGTLLATCGCDGKIIIWDFSGAEPKLERTIEGVIPTVIDTQSPEYCHDCSASWHPAGQYFVVATRTHDIISVSKSTWSKSAVYTSKEMSGAITALCLSPNGAYLASASKSGVFIWSTQDRKIKYRFSEPQVATVTQIAFSPSSNLLAWMDMDGSLTRWRDPIPKDAPSPYEVKKVEQTVNSRAKAMLFGEDVEDMVGDATGGDEDQPDVVLDDDMDMDDDFVVDDLGGALLDDKPELDRYDGEGVREMVSVTKAQPPFQPGSTPMQGKRRYLAFNMIGVIEVTDQETHHIVNVEFHDKSARKSYHFTDYFKYDLAALGERGALYSCPPDGDHPAHVAYKPYGTWATQGEWTYDLPPGTKVIGLGAGGPPPRKSLISKSDTDIQGNGNVVIATTEGDLTFLSGGGVERWCMGFEGEFVSMVAGNEWLFVVFRDGSTSMDGSQNLKCQLIRFTDFMVIQDKRLPLLKGRTLKWIGISSEGAPCVYDSAGYLHVMHHFRIPGRCTWARALDADKLERRKGKDESYWPVGVTDGNLMCLILKGRQEHPGWPRPLIQDLQLRMPFRRTDPKEGPMEQQLATETLRLDALKDALGPDELTTDEIAAKELELDKVLIQLIQNACKNDKLPRALDLVKMLHHTASYDMAAKVAGFYHLVGLQEKIEMLKADREEGGDDEDEYGVDPREVARRKREQWRGEGYGAVPPPRQIGESSRSIGHNGVRKAFQDFGPPPAIHRPGLVRAVAELAPSQPSQTTSSLEVALTSSSLANGSGPSYHEGSPSNDPVTFDWEEEQSMSISTAGLVNEGKRKRADLDELVTDTVDASNEGAKRRALGQPRAKANPFAKKTDAGAPKTGIGLGIGNKKPIGQQKSLHKSETFFEKVEAAEMSTGPPKRGKPVKAGMKQKNLFGQLVTEDQDKGSGAKGKQKTAGKEKTKTDPKKKSKSPLPDTAERDAAKGKGSDDQDTQMEDDSQATSNLDSQVQEVETQLEETQLDGSSPPVESEVETQPATETQTEEEETQPETQDGDPIEWEASPPREIVTES